MDVVLALYGASGHGVCISAAGSSQPLGICAVAVGRRGCTLHVMHVLPHARGCGRLAERMWRRMCELLRERTVGERESTRVVRLAVECGFAAKTAHFYMRRLGWQGSDDSQRAAAVWETGRSTNASVGEFEMWYQL